MTELRNSTRKRTRPTLYSHEFAPPPPKSRARAPPPNHKPPQQHHQPPPASAQAGRSDPVKERFASDPRLPNPLSIPCPSIVSYNPTSFSYYTDNKWKFTSELRLLTNYDVLMFQESKLLSGESTAHRSTAPKHTFFYSNNPLNVNIDSLVSCTAGVVTAVKNSFFDKFKINPINLHPDLEGHALVIRMTAHDGSFSINFINIRLTADSDKKLEKQEKQIILLRESLRDHPADFSFLGGDLNFIENADDSTSVDFVAVNRKEWDAFLGEHRLKRVSNDTHTFYSIPADGGTPRSATLDRFYISHSEADLEVVSPIAYSNTAFLSRWATAQNKGRNTHIPVTLRFTPVASKPKNFVKIDDSVLESDYFTPWTEKEYSRLLSTQPEAKPLAKLNLFKEAIRNTAVKIKKARVARHARFAPFQKAVTLYRLLATRNPSDSEILKVTKDFPDLNSLFHRTSTGWFTRDLKNFIDDTLAVIGVPEKNFGQNDAPDPPPLQVKAGKSDVISDIKFTLPSTRSKVKALRPTTDGLPSTDPVVIGPVIQNHYKKIWSRCASSADDKRKMTSFLSDYDRKVKSELIKPVSLEVILQAIDVAPSTSPGPDGIPFRAYKLLNATAGPLLFEVFNFLKCARTAGQLGDFNFATLFLIPKKETQLIDDTRPISCNNTCNRLIARAVVICIGDAVQQLIGDYQKMFLPSRQMTDHIRHLNKLFYEAVQGNSDKYVLFMDNRKAFDSIHHDFIFASLEKQGFPAWVVSLVKNLMEGAMVEPSLAPGFSISIERGVKQGCPLSPLLFILVYDILHHKLVKNESLEIMAAADDLAVAADSIDLVCSAFPVIDEYCQVSGLGVNRDKTEIISARNSGVDYNRASETIARSAWPLVKMAGKHKYLGIIIGREVQVPEIYEAPLKKAMERAALFRSTLRRFDVQKRILVFNVFVTPIFSFVQQFYVMPGSIYQTYTNLMMKMISPWNGTAWPYAQLVAPFRSGGFRQPLTDPWVFGTSLLLRKVDFKALKSEEDLPWRLDGTVRGGDIQRSLNYDSPLFSDHYNLSLMEFLGDEFLNWDGQTPLNFSKADIKCVSIQHGILHYTGPRSGSKSDLLKDFYHHIADRYKLHESAASPNSFSHFKVLSKQTPYFLISHYIKCLCNALPTDSKRRFVDPDCSTHHARSPTNKYPCYLCDFGDGVNHGDRCKHIFSDCPSAKSAVMSALCSPDGPGDKSFTNIFLKKTTPLYILDFPTAPEKCNYSRLGFILCALWSIWSALIEVKKGRSRNGVVQRITQNLLSMKEIWSRSTRSGTSGKYGSASSRSSQQKLVCKRDAERLVGSFPKNSLLIFTDGSSRGNPGPAGAGALITAPGLDEVRILFPLGR